MMWNSTGHTSTSSVMSQPCRRMNAPTPQYAPNAAKLYRSTITEGL